MFLSKPRTDIFLYWLGESFVYEGEATTGSIVEEDAAWQKHVTIEQVGDFRRIGLLDGLALFWQRLSSAKPLTGEDTQLLDEAARDPNNWFVAKDGADHYVLRCCKLPFGTYVWKSMKAGDDGKAESKKERVPKQAEEDRGNMDWIRFSKWMDNMLDHFIALQFAENMEELADQMAKMNPPVIDLGVLPALRGRKPLIIMDGASYHKKTDPSYVQLEGQKGLYGREGRGKLEPAIGWGKHKCILWLWLGQFAQKKDSYDDAKARLDEAHAKHLHEMEGLDVLVLRQRVHNESHGQRFMVRTKGFESSCGVTFTPPYVGKFWNPVELLWSAAKRAYRRLPKESRRNETMAVQAMSTILKDFRHKEQCLTNMCLPGFRFSFAVLSAFYHHSVVEYNGRRVLFPSLQQAIFDYADQVRLSVECPVAGDEEQEFAFDLEASTDTMRRAPDGLSRLKFPVSVLHRDRSLRRFRLIQVDMQSIVEVPDVVAAPPAMPELMESPIDDIYESEDAGAQDSITSTHVEAGTGAGAIEEKPVVERARPRQDRRRIRPLVPMLRKGIK